VKPQDPEASARIGTDNVTEEVADEGGSPGDLEVKHTETGRGSEAGETWRPAESRQDELQRDESPGRRSP